MCLRGVELGRVGTESVHTTAMPLSSLYHSQAAVAPRELSRYKGGYNVLSQGPTVRVCSYTLIIQCPSCLLTKNDFSLLATLCSQCNHGKACGLCFKMWVWMQCSLKCAPFKWAIAQAGTHTVLPLHLISDLKNTPVIPVLGFHWGEVTQCVTACCIELGEQLIINNYSVNLASLEIIPKQVVLVFLKFVQGL